MTPGTFVALLLSSLGAVTLSACASGPKEGSGPSGSGAQPLTSGRSAASIPRKCPGKPPQIALYDSYDHTRFAPIPGDVVFRFSAYTASFDSDDDDDNDGTNDYRATPEWVAYEIKRYPFRIGDRYQAPPKIGRSKWYEHEGYQFLYIGRSDGVSVEPTKRKLDLSYKSVNQVQFPNLVKPVRLERGHLAQKVHADRISWQAGCNTHFFYNAVPQSSGMNGGVWLRLESYTGALANKVGQVWIIAGPIYDRDKPILLLGEPGEVPVAVPHALYKVVVWRDANQAIQARGFIFRQDREYKRSCAWNTEEKLPAFVVPISQIQEQTGLQFFTGLQRSLRERLLNNTNKNLWLVELEFYGCMCGNCPRPAIS